MSQLALAFDVAEAAPPAERSWCDDLVVEMAAMAKRAEEECQRLRVLHARILGCPVEELDARIEAEERERAESMARHKAEWADRAATERARPAKNRGAKEETSVAASRNIGQDVLSVLSGCSVEGDLVVLPPEKLERKLYERVNDVLAALGGKWNRKRRGHVFADDPSGRIDDAILTGTYERPSDHGFFPTPRKIVARLLELAEIESGHRLLEPSAGVGNIADELAKYAGTTLECVDFLPENAAKLRAKAHAVHEGDFLAWQGGPFDRIVMNPPFAKQADIAHVVHAYDMLAPGGRLVSVMAAGVTFRQDSKAVGFRLLVESCGTSATRRRCGPCRAARTPAKAGRAWARSSRTTRASKRGSGR